MKLVVQYSETVYYEEEIEISPETFDGILILSTKEWDADPSMHEYFDNDFDIYLKTALARETNLTDYLTFSPTAISDSEGFEYEVVAITQD
jgi:hypothetical protein